MNPFLLAIGAGIGLYALFREVKQDDKISDNGDSGNGGDPADKSKQNPPSRDRRKRGVKHESTESNPTDDAGVSTVRGGVSDNGGGGKPDTATGNRKTETLKDSAILNKL